jgi:RNA polymerase sigma factor (sigma-70 family)
VATDPLRLADDPHAQVVGRRLTELFEEHGRMVYGLCRALLRNPDDADDATQATFVSAYRSLLAGSEVREPAAWLATIARNECGARARARMREPLPLFEADLGYADGPETELERRAVVEELQQAISQLPQKQREAVVLRDLYGLPYAEVSAALGLSAASVESLLFRARRTLRVSLRPLASGALAVPVAVREGIAQAVPLFGGVGAVSGGAVGGASGLGLLAKLSGGPMVVKVAAGLAAVAAAGSAAMVEAEHPSSTSKPRVAASSPPNVKLVAGRVADRPAGSPVRSPVVGRNDPAEGEGKGGRSSVSRVHGGTSGFARTAHTAALTSGDGQDGLDSDRSGGGEHEGAATHDGAVIDDGSSRRNTPLHASSLSGSGAGSHEGRSQGSVQSDDSTDHVLAANPSAEPSDSGVDESAGTDGGGGAVASRDSGSGPPTSDGTGSEDSGSGSTSGTGTFGGSGH